MKKKTTPRSIDPKKLAQKCIRWLNSEEGKAAMQQANERCLAFAEELKKTRPTTETWNWTPTI